MTWPRIHSKGHAAVTSKRGSRRGAFSLVELLVVIAIISMLISILLPSLRRSLRQAAVTVCMHNLKQIGQGIDLYKIESNGWIPPTTGSEDARDSEPPLSVWFQKLLSSSYLSHPAVMVCPEDPLRSWLLPNCTSGVYSRWTGCSYGMNGFVLESPGQYLCHTERHQPERPHEILLIADMGPDGHSMGYGGPSSLPTIDRNNGTLSWDDGYQAGDPGEQKSWLSTRHLGGINVLMLDGGVQWVATRDLMYRGITEYDSACAAGSCTLCLNLIPHYSFAVSQTFWWTGTVPLH